MTPDPTRVRRLVVRATNWIGDAVMSEPALSALRAAFPHAQIIWLARPSVAELFWHHPAVDGTLVYDHRGRHAGLSGKWRLASQLRRQDFDLAVLFQNALEAALLALLAGIPRRYGYATDARSVLLTHAVPVPAQTPGTHQTQYYLDLLAPLGVGPSPGPPTLFVTDAEEEGMRRRLAAAGIDRDEVILGLNPGSMYGGAKRWLPERYAQAADRLAQDRGLRVVIIGAPGEEALARSIADRMQVKPVVFSGQTSIRELMAISKCCGLFLTNDTGPMHIAAAFGVPVVAVFGPTDWRTTAPSGNHHRIVRQPVECSPCLLRECPIDHRCMTRVSVEQVTAAAVDLQALQSASATKAAAPTPPMRARAEMPPSPSPNEDGGLRGVTVFLDRDGTMNRDTGYITHPDELDLLPGVVQAVAALNRGGATVVLVTNQSGLARGLLTVEQLKAIHGALQATLHRGGARLDAIYYCPHHPDEGCLCRKPQPGMVHRAVADLDLHLGSAYLVGDQLRDVELAKRVGVTGILVTSGPTSQDALVRLQQAGVLPDAVVDGLPQAVEWIMEHVRDREASRQTLQGNWAREC